MTGSERPPVGRREHGRHHEDVSPTRHFEEMSPVGHYAENELVEAPQLVRRRFPTFTRRETNVAMGLALAAWTVAVFDYGLFGTLLPAMQQDFGWTAEWAYFVNTLIAVGTAIVAFGVGPVIDRLGRRRGMMTTIGGTAVASALTSVIPRRNILLIWNFNIPFFFLIKKIDSMMIFHIVLIPREEEQRENVSP